MMAIGVTDLGRGNTMRNLLMMLCMILLVAVSVRAGALSDLLPGIHADELKQDHSPDGHSKAILIHKVRRGLPLPGPEPPKTLARWARLTWIKDGKTIYDSGDEPLNIYQMSPTLALDIAWSPDSQRLAYRYITGIRIISSKGEVIKHNMADSAFVTASFRWIDNENLIVVSKKEQYPLGMSGRPDCYQGYIDQAKEIWIGQLNVATGYTARYRQPVSDPTFLFHAVGFRLDEISTKADRVAFSDGANLCIYDVKAGKIVAKVGLPQKPSPKPDLTGPDMKDPTIRAVTEEMAARPAQLEGIWWATNDQLVLGMGLLGGPVKSFYAYDISTKVMSDKTDTLLPAWDGNEKAMSYQDPDWFRLALK